MGENIAYDRFSQIVQVYYAFSKCRSTFAFYNILAFVFPKLLFYIHIP